jgi:peptidoglycan/LPS O-acetylase OafA/YrhL
MKPEAHAAHRPEIDGLRAVAVLAVLIFHLNRLWLPGGFAGVDVFFTLSGYLVTGILLRSKDLGTFSLADFWQRRLARIFPAFFAMAVTTLTVAFFLYDDWDFASTGAAFTAALSAWANHHQLSLGGYFSLSDDTQPLLHTWSLAVEEQFYLLFPLCFLGRSSASPRQRLALTATAALLSFASCLWLAARHPSLGFYLLPSRAWELLAGSLLAITHHHRLLPTPAQPQRFTNTGTALIFLSFLVLHEHQPFPGWRALLPVLGTAAILHGGNAGFTGRSLASTPATYLGRLSYSLYLWHWPVFSFIDYHFLFSPNATRLSLKILLTAIAALTCHHALEIPLRSLLRHPNRRRFVWLATAAALLIGIPSGLLIRRDFYKDGTDSPSGILTISPATPNPARRPIILIGDSQATMYSRVLADIANARGQSLIILSAAGGDPLAPPPGSPPSDLWNLCLSTAQREHPATIVLSCHWIYKLGNRPDRLSRTLDALSPLADHLVILYQPPIPPHSASRQAIRLGSRPPFFESPEDATARQRAADLVSIVAGGRSSLSIIDTVPLFTTPDGAVRAFSPDLHPLFHDRAHLSSSGAALVRPLLESACSFTP